MNRPFADDRPFGPFAARDDSIVFKSTYDATGMSKVPIDELEDNLEDRLTKISSNFDDVNVSSLGGFEDVTVRIEYSGEKISDSQEDEMVRIIKAEIERLGASGVRNSSYEYIF